MRSISVCLSKYVRVWGSNNSQQKYTLSGVGALCIWHKWKMPSGHRGRFNEDIAMVTHEPTHRNLDLSAVCPSNFTYVQLIAIIMLSCIFFIRQTEIQDITISIRVIFIEVIQRLGSTMWKTLITPLTIGVNILRMHIYIFKNIVKDWLVNRTWSSSNQASITNHNSGYSALQILCFLLQWITKNSPKNNVLFVCTLDQSAVRPPSRHRHTYVESIATIDAFAAFQIRVFLFLFYIFHAFFRNKQKAKIYLLHIHWRHSTVEVRCSYLPRLCVHVRHCSFLYFHFTE